MKRSAPVLGRSDIQLSNAPAISENGFALHRCSARGRARSEGLVFIILISRADEGGFQGLHFFVAGINTDDQRCRAGFHRGRIEFDQHGVFQKFLGRDDELSAHDLQRAGGIFQPQFHRQFARGFVDDANRVKIAEMAVGHLLKERAGRTQQRGLDIGASENHQAQHRRQREQNHDGSGPLDRLCFDRRSELHFHRGKLQRTYGGSRRRRNHWHGNSHMERPGRVWHRLRSHPRRRECSYELNQRQLRELEEYCCGDGDSNGYGGAFVPSPGDEIYSQEWYCDSKGKSNIGGGYGCTYLVDKTTGAILSCTSATGSPCWSVQALPLCSVSPGTPNCMTLGLAAEFVIENQTPQCCSPATAFTDLTSTVNMFGSAYSSTTNSYSQTISTDPIVDVLEDFTNTTSHMGIALGKTDQTYFTVSQFKRVGGPALSFLVPCPTSGNDCYPQSIAVGPNANGSTIGDPWVLGTGKTSAGHYYVFQWRNSSWVRTVGAGLQIAVSPQGYAWVITHLGTMYYWNGSTFVLAPGNGCATSIGVGPNAYGSQYGDPWIIGCDGSDIFNGSIYQLQGSAWVKQPGAANQIAVSPQGVPLVLTSSGSIFYWNGSYFTGAPAGCASSIAVGPVTAPLAGPYGDVWITGCGDVTNAGAKIFQLQNGTSWVQIPGVASQISVSPDLGVPWVVTLTGQIFE